MVKESRYTTLALAALLLAVSCTQQEPSSTYRDDPDAVRISAQVGNGEGSPATRSTPVSVSPDEEKSFNSGDRVCITADGQPAVVYTLQDGSTLWSPEEGKYLKWNTPTMNFTAWYPAAEGVNADNFTVPADQSDAAKIASADYMTFQQPVTRDGDNPVSLNFERRMARIMVFPRFNNQFNSVDYTVSEVIVCGNTNGYASGSPVSVPVEVKAYNNNGLFYALLSPTSASSETFIKVKVVKNDGTEEHSLEAKGIIATEAGKSYIVNLTVGKNMASVARVTVSDWVASGEITGSEADQIPYVTFSAASGQKFSMTLTSFTLEAGEYFEYSVGGGNWTRFTKTVENIAFGGALGNLRLRGKSIYGTATSTSNYSKISFSNAKVSVKCTGDIRTLIDYTTYSKVETGYARFDNLFQNCTALTSAPELPATNLAKFCYEYMFEGCTALTSAPELPATNLENYCYRYMFNGCTSLETAPALKATSLVTYCYKSMFYGCTKLSSVTMLATDVSGDKCLDNWLTDAGTKANSRTLTLASETVYNTLTLEENSYYLPAIWKQGASNTTVKFQDSSSTE